MNIAPDKKAWTFLTNHGHVMVYLARHSRARVRDIADAVGITERAAVGILGDLVTAGYVTKQRQGRRNSYVLHRDAALRHPEESNHSVGEILEVFTE